MKFITLTCVAALFITACSSPQKKAAGTDTVINGDTIAKAKDTPTNNNTPTVYSLCFLNKEGRDSTSIELVIHGNAVTGLMNWLPYQKDSRNGVLAGTIKNDTLRATWGFMQEGQKDTINLNFLFKNSQLSQKPLKFNAKTGRQQTDEKSGYTIKYVSSNVVRKIPSGK
jgi:hypothetical protein